MATPITKYQDNAGNEFNSDIEAEASNAQLVHQAQVNDFVAANFPVKAGSKRGNPHAGTASKAIYLWIAFMATQPAVAPE